MTSHIVNEVSLIFSARLKLSYIFWVGLVYNVNSVRQWPEAVVRVWRLIDPLEVFFPRGAY